MHLNLQDSGLDCRRNHQLSQHARADITDANVLNKSLLHELFHSSVGLGKGDSLVRGHARVLNIGVVEPSSWVACLDWDELQVDREVNQIHINVVETQVLQGLLAGQLDMLRLVIVVPQLRENAKVLALNQACFNRACDALSYLFLVSVVAGSVKESVACFNSIVYGVSAYIIGNFPAPESDGWDFPPTAHRER